MLSNIKSFFMDLKNSKKVFVVLVVLLFLFLSVTPFVDFSSYSIIWQKIWMIFSLFYIVVIFVLFQERKELNRLPFGTRLQWQVMIAICIASLSLSLSKLVVIQQVGTILSNKITLSLSAMPSSDMAERNAAPSSVDKGSEPENSAMTKVKEEINFLGTLFAWLLAVVALVIAFVTSWVSAIAKEAKEQVAAVNATLDLDAKIFETKSSLLRVDLILAMTVLLEGFDRDGGSNERMGIKWIRNIVSEGETLFGSMVDFEVIFRLLDEKRQSLENLGGNLDPKYLDFLRKQVAPYLENLHARLQAARISENPKGRECMEEISKLWRLFR